MPFNNKPVKKTRTFLQWNKYENKVVLEISFTLCLWYYKRCTLFSMKGVLFYQKAPWDILQLNVVLYK